MKSSAQVVVIGGGVVGASVLYHLTKAGWTDVMLLERRELTAGSTWHAAGGMHTLNGDPNVSKLQQYTIKLYEEIERISGQDCSIHLPGGLMLADTEVRMDFLRMAVARGRYLGMDLELITANEARDLFPLMDPQYFVGALYDPVEGHVDPTGVTRAYVKCAQLAGAEVHQHTPVVGLSQRPDGTWDVRVESGDVIHAEHVVNAGGLWAREVGRMVGIELPVLAMEHIYLITQDMPEVAAHVKATGHEMPMALDFGGEIYIRQEGGAMLLGTYEQACVPWSPRETPWDFGSQLLKPDLDRITPELQVAFQHYPAMGTTGIRRVVNGPFTFSPDGNPLVGPIRGLRGYWVACGVMAGLSQGGGVGLALATWMTAGDHGDSGMDVWAMDVARYGDYATLAYTNAKVQENYRRRFRITFPNEELPAARPLLTTPIHDRLTDANAVWGASFGLEHALWFQAAGLPPVEDVTFRRSNAWEQVAGEVAAVRERVGLTEISNYAKYRVTGPGAEAWLSSLLTARMPAAGRITLTAMLNDQGRIVGEFTVARATEASEYYLFGSLGAEVHHSRWFSHHLPADGSVQFEVLGLRLTGLSIAGPAANEVLAAIADVDVSTEALRFMDFRRMDLGPIPALVARINYAGDLGYELWVAPEYQRVLYDRVMAAGAAHGIRLFGFRALMSLRLEKSYGTWFREYRPIYTPLEAGITRYLKLDHDFIGRAAHEAEVAAGGPVRRLVTLVVEPDPDDPADVIGDEPIWHDGSVVGWVTSGGYGHHVAKSIALGYVPTALSTPDGPGGERVRDRDHRPPPAGAAPAGAVVRPAGRPDAPVTEVVAAAEGPAPVVAPGRIVVDGRPVPFEAGDSIAVAILRGGEVPGRGGTLCLAGDCGNCLAQVDGIAYVRTCQTPARAGLRVARHPAGAMPQLPVVAAADPTATPLSATVELHHLEVDVAVIGGGSSGRAAAAEAELAGHTVRVLDAGSGDEVVAIYAGPMIVVRTQGGMLHVHPHEIVVATGSAEIHPVCPGNRLAGIVTARAAEWLYTAGVDLGRVVVVGSVPAGVPATPVAGRLVRFDGDEGRVRSVVMADPATGLETSTPADTVVVGLGFAPRDLLARMAGEVPVRVVGDAAKEQPLPPPPTDGVVCGCMGTTAADLADAWDHGYRELELLKRASQACLGPCQGGACLPNVRAWIAARTGEVPEPFTARPASRQITLAEAAADTYVDAFRKTPLHDEHLAAGARMDRFGGWWRPWHYGDAVSEYWAVREGVSIGDVSTLGKLVVSGAGRRGAAGTPLSRATWRTSSPAGRATRSSSTSAATSWTTG